MALDPDKEPPGPNDDNAPVAGATLSEFGADDFKEMTAGLSRRRRAKVALWVLRNKPEQLAAAKQRRRDRFRMALTILLVVGIIADAFAALYVTELSKTQSWDTMKDWLVLALAPLIVAVTVAVAFWFPVRETD